MGPVKMWERLAVVGAIALAMSVSYCVGKKQGVMDSKLAENSRQIAVSDRVTKTVTSKVDSTRKWADTVVIYRDRVRAKVEVKSDTILVHDSVVAVSPEVAQLIQADDSTIAALKTVIVAQDSLIARLREGQALRDERITLLEKAATPGKLSKLFTATKYIAIGAVLGAAFSK